MLIGSTWHDVREVQTVSHAHDSNKWGNRKHNEQTDDNRLQ